MLISKDNQIELIEKFKKHSAQISELEINRWANYDYMEAYDLFWPNQYLKLYIQVIEDAINNDVELSEKELNKVIESCKEILNYTLNIEL